MLDNQAVDVSEQAECNMSTEQRLQHVLAPAASQRRVQLPMESASLPLLAHAAVAAAFGRHSFTSVLCVHALHMSILPRTTGRFAPLLYIPYNTQV